MRAAFWILVLVSVAMIATDVVTPPSAGPRELRLAYVMAPGGAAHEAAERFAAEVRDATGGSVEVRLFPGGQLGTDRELAESLMIGSVDLVVGGAAPIGWYLPEYGALEAPFAFRDYGHMDRVLSGPLGNEVAAAFEERKGIRILAFWHRGPRYLTTTSRRVERPEDLAGLKLRVPELPTYIEAWRILGASPTPITYSEIFMALKQGIVEGQENPLEVIVTGSLDEVQRYAMRTQHLLGFYLFMANAERLDGLPEAARAAVQRAAIDAGRFAGDAMLRHEQRFERELRERGMEFVDVDREAFRRRALDELPRRFEGAWAPGFFARMAETP